MFCRFFAGFLALPFAVATAHAVPAGQTPQIPFPLPTGMGGTGGAGGVGGTGFTATGGIAARAPADRAADAINLREFGIAIGNGSSATSAISAAFSSTTSPTVQISSGVYGLGTGTYTAASGLSLIGAGIGQTVIQLPSSCSQTGDLLRWINKSNIHIQDLTIDLNGCSVANGLSGAVSIFQGSNIYLERVSIINAGSSGWLEFSANGTAHGWLTDSYFQATAPHSTQNQAINLSVSGGAVSDWHIERNTLINTGALISGNNIHFVANEISGWGYGAGVSTGQGTTNNSIVQGNRIHDSQTGLDSDSTYPNGIEGWGANDSYNGNTIWNIAASCIYSGGANQIVSNNLCWGAGKRADGVGAVGIQSGYLNSGANGNGSSIVSNKVRDDGTGTTTYGYGDSVSSSGVTLRSNIFAGSLGAANIVGNTTADGGTSDNRIINPCFAVDQRQEGGFAAPSVGYTVDRWKGAASNTAMTYQRIASSSMPGCGFQMQVRPAVTVTSPAAGFISFMSQAIEAQDLYDLQYGTAYAKSLVADFCASSQVAGTFPFALQNPNAGRSWVSSFTLASANVAQCFSFIIPGDMSSLSLTPTNAGLIEVFDWGSGGNSQTSTKAAWVTGNFTTLTTITAPLNSNAPNTLFNISSLRLYPGGFDVPWIPRTYAEELRRAQRYFFKSFPAGVKPAQSGGIAGAFCVKTPGASIDVSQEIILPVQMVKKPTVALFNPLAPNSNWRDVTASADVTSVLDPLSAMSINGLQIVSSGSSATAGDNICIHLTADADY